MKNDEFGNRMKGYEHAPLKDSYDGRNPLYMRLDGRGFSKLTKRLKLVKPRDDRMSTALEMALHKTMGEFNFIFGFSQSDEISLYFPVLKNELSQLPFGGKTYKLLSVIPAYFSTEFTKSLLIVGGNDQPFLDAIFESGIAFDGRICEFPDETEATNMLIWRFKDAYRNYVSDTALTKFSHKELDNVSHAKRIEMIGHVPNSNDACVFMRPFKIELTSEENGPIIRNKLRVCEPDIGFENMTFEQRHEFIYSDMDGVSYHEEP